MKKFFILFVICLVVIIVVIQPYGNKYNASTIVNVSIDDVNESLNDLYENESYSSIFHQPFFSFLKSCHTKYGCKFTLYVYADNIQRGGIQENLKKNLTKILIG